ncbi:MAG: hypothetical protein WD157_00390 [Patescibacteria group bacterium]
MKTIVTITVNMPALQERDYVLDFLSTYLAGAVNRCYPDQVREGEISLEPFVFGNSNAEPTEQQVSVEILFMCDQVYNQLQLRQCQRKLVGTLRKELQNLRFPPEGLEVLVSTRFQPIEAFSEKVPDRQPA